MKRNEKLRKFILENPDLSNREGSEKYGCKMDTYRQMRYRMGKKSPTPDNQDDIKEEYLKEVCERAGIPIDTVNHYWYKTQFFSIFAKKGKQSYLDIRDAIVSEMKKYAPHYPKIKRTKLTGGHLLVVDPADVHFGKLGVKEESGEDYNLKIAETRFTEAIDELIYRVRDYNIDYVVLVLGNDALHIDNPRRTTTSGTPQDTDGMWWEAFQLAKKCYINAIEKLVQVADVKLIHCPSNHDFMSGFMLADTVMSWFSKSANVSGDVSPSHRKYVWYEQNLIGFSHGDSAKGKDLGSLMAKEGKVAWGGTSYRYWYIHHKHHKERFAKDFDQRLFLMEKDKIGYTEVQTGLGLDPTNTVYIEVVRSPTPPDRWHFSKGYVNVQAIEAFIHHPYGGQVSRLSHYF